MSFFLLFYQNVIFYPIGFTISISAETQKTFQSFISVNFRCHSNPINGTLRRHGYYYSPLLLSKTILLVPPIIKFHRRISNRLGMASVIVRLSSLQGFINFQAFCKRSLQNVFAGYISICIHM